MVVHHDVALTCLVRHVEVGSVLEQKSAELIGEPRRAVVCGNLLVALRQLGIHPMEKMLHARLDRVRVFGADGVQQRLAGVVARRDVEGDLRLDEAQQSSAVLRDASRVHRAVDAVEALQEGRS